MTQVINFRGQQIPVHDADYHMLAHAGAEMSVALHQYLHHHAHQLAQHDRAAHYQARGQVPPGASTHGASPTALASKPPGAHIVEAAHQAVREIRRSRGQFT